MGLGKNEWRERVAIEPGRIRESLGNTTGLSDLTSELHNSITHCVTNRSYPNKRVGFLPLQVGLETLSNLVRENTAIPISPLFQFQYFAILFPSPHFLNLPLSWIITPNLRSRLSPTPLRLLGCFHHVLNTYISKIPWQGRRDSLETLFLSLV